MVEKVNGSKYQTNEIIRLKSASTSSSSKNHYPIHHTANTLFVLETLDKSTDYSENQIVLNEVDFRANDETVVSQIFNKLNKNYTCSMCKGNLLICVNQCGHLICLECLLKRVQEKKNCSVCDEEFKESLIQTIVHNASNLTSEKIKIICRKCKTNEIPTDLKNTCGHLCLSCVKSYHKKFIDECPICFQRLFDENLFPYSTKKVLCEGCDTKRGYFDENCQKFKCGHTLCGNCIKFSIQSMKCKLCENNLNNLELLQFIKAVTEQCSKCKKNVALAFITMYTCCKAFICKRCTGHHKCIKSSEFNFK